MAESFESKLIRAAGEDNLKRGKQLLKNECLVCAYRNAKGKLNAVFRDKKGLISQVEVNSQDNRHRCTCETQDGLLCEHAVATILHFSRFNAPPGPIAEEPAQYRGLKYDAFSELAEQSLIEPDA